MIFSNKTHKATTVLNQGELSVKEKYFRACIIQDDWKASSCSFWQTIRKLKKVVGGDLIILLNFDKVKISVDYKFLE